MFQTFSWHHVDFLAQAGLWTLLLSLIALAGGAIFGALLMLSRISIYPALRLAASAYIFIVQGIPLLVLLFIAYFGIAFAGSTCPRSWQPASHSPSMRRRSSARSGVAPSKPWEGAMGRRGGAGPNLAEDDALRHRPASRPGGLPPRWGSSSNW